MKIKKSLLNIHLEGLMVKENKISLPDFIQIMSKTQTAIKRLAVSILGKSEEIKRGRPSKDIKSIDKACTLELIGYKPGSVQVDLELTKGEPDLFEEHQIGRQALEYFIQGVDSLGKDPLAIPLYFNQGVLLTLEDLGRNLSCGIDVIDFNLQEDEKVTKARFNPIIRDRVVKLLQEPTKGMTNIRGVLLELNIEKSTCQIFPTETEYIKCNYEQEMESLLVEGLKHRVRVSGEGKFLPSKTLPENLKIRHIEILEQEEIIEEKKIFTQENDPILMLSGLGKEIWKDVDPDEYVRKLREGWK
ncbi:MAG: hypothetical protein AB1349_03405 [Elusimicrobiota bacterium]